jgi:hypothetical protein
MVLRGPDADDFDFFADLDDAALDTPVTTVPRPEIEKTSSIGIRNGLSMARSASGCRCRRLRAAEDGRLRPFRPLVPFDRLQRRPLHDRNVVAREVVLRQQLPHFHFDQFQQFGLSSTMSPCS